MMEMFDVSAFAPMTLSLNGTGPRKNYSNLSCLATVPEMSKYVVILGPGLHTERETGALPALI